MALESTRELLRQLAVGSSILLIFNPKRRNPLLSGTSAILPGAIGGPFEVLF